MSMSIVNLYIDFKSMRHRLVLTGVFFLDDILRLPFTIKHYIWGRSQVTGFICEMLEHNSSLELVNSMMIQVLNILIDLLAHDFTTPLIMHIELLHCRYQADAPFATFTQCLRRTTARFDTLIYILNQVQYLSKMPSLPHFALACTCFKYTTSQNALIIAHTASILITSR